MREVSERELTSGAFARLADDYDRWGLACEAESMRARYRDAIVRELIGNALAVGAVRRALPTKRRTT